MVELLKVLLNVLATLRLSLNCTITSELKGKQEQSYFQIETTRVSSAYSYNFKSDLSWIWTTKKIKKDFSLYQLTIANYNWSLNTTILLTRTSSS